MSDDNFNQHCEALLARYNRRNTKAVTRHLESLCGFLRQKGNVVQTMFGGARRAERGGRGYLPYTGVSHAARLSSRPEAAST